MYWIPPEFNIATDRHCLQKAQLSQELRTTTVRVWRPLWYKKKSKLSRKPHCRSKHHVDRQTGCEVMAIFVYLRWPSAAILDFVDMQIAPFDLPTPTTLAIERNIEWIGCTVPFARHWPLNYTVTLKLGFGVTQGHLKWHYSIEHIRIYIGLLWYTCLYDLLLFSRYSRILIENRYALVFDAPVSGEVIRFTQ